ncbi:hypothetical protein FOZ63_002780, partial [Perkinsus olseni]
IPAHSQAVADLTCLRGRRVASVGSDGRLALSSLLGSAPRVLQQVDLGWKPSAVRSVGTDGLTVVVGGVDGQLQCFDESRLPAIYDPKSTRRKKGARMGETAPASPKREKVAASAELGNTTPSSWAPELPVDSLAAFSSSTWKTDFSSARSRAGYTQRLKDIREAYGVISNASKSDEAKLDYRVSQLLDMCVDIVEKQKKRWDQVRGALTQMARRTDSLETVRIVENLALDLGDTMKVESRIVELSKKVHASSVNHRAAENKCETLRKQAKKLESELTVTKIELANRTKECGALQRRVNASARRYEQLSKNVDTLHREL